MYIYIQISIYVHVYTYTYIYIYIYIYICVYVILCTYVCIYHRWRHKQRSWREHKQRQTDLAAMVAQASLLNAIF